MTHAARTSCFLQRFPGPGLAAWALALLPQSDGGGDWPRWRGAHFDDATEAGGLLERPFTLRERWRAQVGTGYSGISVLGSTAVTMGASEGFDQVVALDAASGAVRWRHRLGKAFPGVDGAEDGPVSTPTLADDAVYALSPHGELVALALADGKQRWSVPLAERGAATPHWGFTTAPLVAGELVIVAAGAGTDATFQAFARSDGALRWSAGTDQIHYQSPILARVGGEELVVGAGNSFLFGLAPATGTVRWRVPHGGSDFYQQIVQPLALAEDELLLKTQRTTSRRVHVELQGDGAELETLWTSRYLSQNYNTSVLCDGLLFGHCGDFLSCVDAESGDLLWRSRPPGNGWLIRVDSWLVILTKEGSLHFAPALAEGYEEHAALQLFERLAWTPPSFAHGAVFARDSSGVAACVEVVPAASAARAKVTAAPVPALFDTLEREVAVSDLPTEVVDEFMAKNGPFPRIEGERTVHFVYRGAAQDLVLVGDMLDDGGEIPMRRVPGTDLFWATCELEPDARIGYRFVRDLDETLTDPLNPRRGLALSMGGDVSELRMPRAPAPETPVPPAHSGTRETFVLDVPLSNREGRPWGGPRRVWVHLPPGYAQGTGRYPVLLVNDGANGLDALEIPATLDRLAGDRMQPVIAVFIERQSAYEFARAERDQYRDMLLERVLPEVDARYRTRTDPGSRAVLGFGEGAFAALFAALSRSDAIGAGAAVSLDHGSSQGQRELEGLVAAAKTLPLVCLDWGRYDTRESARGFDTDRTCRALAAALEARGARVRTSVSNDGDECSFWRARLPELFAALFPPAR